MALRNMTSERAIIEKIVSYAKRQLVDQKESKLVCKFIRLYYAHTSADDLRAKAISDLYGAALMHWKQLQESRPSQVEVSVFNPHFELNGWQSTRTVIMVTLEDMPFLVDSIQMEINRMGITIHLMVYTGGINVVRDNDGNVVDLTSYTSKGPVGFREAPIYLEIDHQHNPERFGEIKQNLLRILRDVRAIVTDWTAMKSSANEMIQELSNYKEAKKSEDIQESIEFLKWMLMDHFTFLGVRDYQVEGKGDTLALRLVKGSGLGVMRDDSSSKVTRQFSDLPDRVRRMMLSKDQVLIISKTNTRSTVHRPTYTDYIGVKRFNEKGELIGERRFIGLYTSIAYSSNPRYIPFLRLKTALILKMSGLPERSHAGKDLSHIISTLPRDDLFQSSPKELFELSIGILHLQQRRRFRLFVRKDVYGRFISCLVYVPRENFNTDLIQNIQDILMKEFSGVEAGFSTHFTDSILARIHYVIRLEHDNGAVYDVKAIEQKLLEVSESWKDNFRSAVLDYFGEERGNRIFFVYGNAFPAGYREVFTARNAIYDIEHIEHLGEEDHLGMSFYRPLGATKDVMQFKLFRYDETVPLSDALPMLENMGLRVIGEVPYLITPKNGRPIWINDFNMTYVAEPNFEIEEVKSLFQEAFNKIWMGEAEDDKFNSLVLEAQLNWREISFLRAIAKYLRQTGFTYSQEYIAQTVVNNPEVSRMLIVLFRSYFDPKLGSTAQERAKKIEELILQKLDAVAILDEDRILRRFLAIIHSIYRTNYFQVDAEGQPKKYISFKLDPKRVPGLPLPLPEFEIFVYSPRFEGVHLRAGKVARGGIRWSDRREDYRTEVLGLMKAQRVKNAVIVPTGAKGTFIAKKLLVNGTREEILQEGIASYKGFISGLLDLTDNLSGNENIPPADTVCYDEPDPYLVVAADKGTATFSDIANSISLERNFWLGDAFASGGSTGYDHKKMGITARGAWVSAQRHFQELGINVDETEITVVGIGDMSGDVFGNGLLMSKNMKLVAAFNHMHIFLDPNPDAGISYAERQRLFDLPRSTWEDYNPKLMSKGGGVYRRSLKAIPISPEVRKVLNTKKDSMVPSELIRAILKAPVDIIWNGGIGTYAKASTERNADAGDRSNDVVRVDAKNIRARAVCEGGNLGFTQRARIEYEQKGGLINTDFIDNSGGVDCSDHEVNIKILLNSVVASGDLTEKQRNKLLENMTEEVASLVLSNNYHQNEAISFGKYASLFHKGLYIRYIDYLQDAGKINRELEYLPSHHELVQRQSDGKSLTKPELSVLFAYAKILLKAEIADSDLTKDLYLSQIVAKAFPTPLRKRYNAQLEKHRLNNEIVATQLSNQLVSDMGITFMYQLFDETGASTAAIVRAYAVAREIYRMNELVFEIDALDFKVDAVVQYRMREELVGMVRRVARWFLRNRRESINILDTINHFSDSVAGLYKRLSTLILGADLESYNTKRDEFIALGVPQQLAERIASTHAMYHAVNIVEPASRLKQDVYDVATVYFTLVDRLGLSWFRQQINAYPADDRWSVLAKSSYKGDLDWIQRELTMSVFKLRVTEKAIDVRIMTWFEKHGAMIARWETMLANLKGSAKPDFVMLSVAIRELSELVKASEQTEQPIKQGG